MESSRPPFYFFATVWGETYRDYFIKLCVASLLAPRNAPALDRPAKLLLSTPEEDWKALQERPLFKKLSEYIEPVWLPLENVGHRRRKMATMSKGHQQGAEIAWKDKAIGMFLTADMILSDGTIERLQELSDSGRKCVLAPAMRYDFGGFTRTVPTLGTEEPLALSPRELAGISVKNLHSESRCYEVDSPWFGTIPPVCPWWRAADDGIVLHTMSWAPLLVDYRAVQVHDDNALRNWTVDGDYVWRNFPNASDIYAIMDSDELMIVGLTFESDLACQLTANPELSYAADKIKKRSEIIARLLNSDVIDPLKRLLVQTPALIHGSAVNRDWDPVISRAKKVIETSLSMKATKLAPAKPRAPRSDFLHVYCHRNEAPAEHVNILYDMVRRNLSERVEGEFVCLTSNPSGLDEGILAQEPHDLPTDETGFVLSVDSVIVGPLDGLIEKNSLKRLDLPWIKEVVSYWKGMTLPLSARVVLFDNGVKPDEASEDWAKQIWKRNGLTLATIDTTCNVPDDKLYANVVQSCGMDCRRLGEISPHEKQAIIVGGAPSLESNLDEIRWRANGGQKVFALNNSARYLRDRGIEVSYQVILDGRPENAAFLDLEGTHEFLIASQADPSLIEKLPPERTILWHADAPDIRRHMPPQEQKKALMIGGGTTVLTRTMIIAHVMGYRTCHLFGCDSSFSGEVHHAYDQALNEKDKPVEVIIGAQRFYSAPWMVAQVNEFKAVAEILAEAGDTIVVHGKGLLPHVARMMEAAQGEEALPRFLYDMTVAPASFDFLTFLLACTVEAQGKFDLSISAGPNDGFRSDSFVEIDLDLRRRFLYNVMLPALELFPVRKFDLFGKAEGKPMGYLPRNVDHKKPFKGITVPKWARDYVSSKYPLNNLVTITLREAKHHSFRNSDLSVWKDVARRLTSQGYNVIFLRDTNATDAIYEWTFDEVHSMALRAALYEKAELNLMRANGPCGLLHTNPNCRYIILQNETPTQSLPQDWFEQIGFEHGKDLPWALPHQRLLWSDENADTIMEAVSTLPPKAIQGD